VNVAGVAIENCRQCEETVKRLCDQSSSVDDFGDVTVIVGESVGGANRNLRGGCCRRDGGAAAVSRKSEHRLCCNFSSDDQTHRLQVHVGESA